MLLSLLLPICLAEAVEEAFITIGDKEFVGPDTRLEQALAQRRALSGEGLASMRDLDTEMSTQLQRLPETRPFNVSTRRQLDMHYKVLGLPVVHDTEDTKAPVLMVTKLIKTLIQKIENKLLDLNPLLKKYKDDNRLRYGNVICWLNLWKKDIATKFVRVALHGHNLPIDYHVTIYQHLLSKSVDIDHVTNYILYKQANHSMFRAPTAATPAPAPYIPEAEVMEI